jgi:protein FAM50
MNKTLGPGSKPLFPYSAEPPTTTSSTSDDTKPSDEIPADYNPLARQPKSSKPEDSIPTSELEGADYDPTFTKVVDRRWYERNKHIYPASIWQDFDPEKDYQTEVKRDAGGNVMFFS